jgi:hypothetical protein
MQLREKAIGAVDDQAFTDWPEDMTFVAARRLTGGAILLEVDRDESAVWLRQPDILRCLNEKFGVSMVINNGSGTIKSEGRQCLFAFNSSTLPSYFPWPVDESILY